VGSTTPSTREQVLQAAAQLFAQRGYRGTSVEDIGAACGISGPAVYKHFTNKHAVLARLLTSISEHLLARGQEVVAAASTPEQALAELVAFHTDFALREPALIRVQDRDLGSLEEREARTVRRLQRGYVELWVAVLRELDPDLGVDAARTRAHATFGLLNSTPHSARVPAVARAQLTAMALRALDSGGRAAAPA
jgi:AcrR family transcriptional regulator